jgi:Amt family ammonium transporter
MALDSGNTAWVLMSAAGVMLMTPGLGFFHSGLTGHKNMANTIIMCMMSMALVTVQWVLVGYAFSFGTGNEAFGDFNYAALRNLGTDVSNVYGVGIPSLAFVAFQNMFAQLTPALISGAVLGRMNFFAYVLFVLLWSIGVYNPIAHWVWSLKLTAEGKVIPHGWLVDLGNIDFAGGTVIHIASGFSALIVSLFLGRRQFGKPEQNNLMIALGTSLLAFGWLFFNSGSQLAADGIAALAFINTHIAACVGLISWVMFEYISTRKVTATGAASGVIAGLVAITPACGYIQPMMSFLFGYAGAFVCWVTLYVSEHIYKSQYDLDAFAIHGMGGVTGALLTGLFAQSKWNPAIKNGTTFGHEMQIVYQLIGVAVVGCFAAVATFIILMMLKYTVGLSLTPDQQIAGADASYHGGVLHREDILAHLPSNKVAEPEADMDSTIPPRTLEVEV